MLPNERTTRSDVITLPGDVEGLVAAPGRDPARPLVAFLKKQGINVQVAMDADEAFEEALVHQPNIIVIDDGIPPSGGVELCQRLKGNTRTHFVPAILWSNEDRAPLRVRALAAGADAFFSPGGDEQEQRARLWALLRTQALHRRQEKKQKTHSNTIQSRRRWVSSFVHDLQSSLAALQANFEYVSQALATPRTGASAELDECLRDTRTLFSQLGRGLRTVLDFERFESGRIVVKEGLVRASELLTEIQRELDWQARSSNKRIEVEVPANETLIKGDRALLKDALQNLIAHLLRQPANHVVTAQVKGQGSRVIISIAGDADVLGSEDRERIFEPYAMPTQKAPVVAHGLGLALSKVVFLVHGGTVAAEEEEGGRYSFVVMLNVDGAPTEQRTIG